MPAASPPDSVLLVDAEREALAITACDLDLHLATSTGNVSTHALLTVRNDGAAPLTHIGLQLSSVLRWQSIALRTGDQLQPVSFIQHMLETDADHTGRASEAVVNLPQPLAPGESLSFTVLYSGTIAQSANRLERIGAPSARAAEADWDTVSPAFTGLRGFGNVLWYPMSAAPALLGDGARLFNAAGREKLRNAASSMRLRLSVEYLGAPPAEAFFAGRQQALSASAEEVDDANGQSGGVAVADFAAKSIGFRVPSLFLTSAPRVQEGGLVSVVSSQDTAGANYARTAAAVAPLLSEWLGVRPLGIQTVIDHEGQSFEDGSLLVTSLQGDQASLVNARMAHSLAHSWFHSRDVWMEEGLAQFMGLLWTERTTGREAALKSLQDGYGALALADSDDGLSGPEGSPGQPLTAPSDDVFYRTKAAAVWWMLRSISGDDALKQALQAFREPAPSPPVSNPGESTSAATTAPLRVSAGATPDSARFEDLLEHTSGKSLQWFFDDWVYRDRGLPDLSIVAITPRPLPATGSRHAGWLVSVEVRNDGLAAAEVPVTVRAGGLTATEQLRIPGRSTASTRIVFDGIPETVTVNDGSVPELRRSLHTMQVNAHPQ